MVVKKRAYFYTVDALIAATLIFVAVLVIPKFYLKEPQSQNLNFVSQDIITTLSTIKVKDSPNSYVQQLITNNNITNTENTLIEQIAQFWALGQSGLAQDLTKNVTDSIIPDNTNFGIWISSGSNAWFTSQNNTPIENSSFVSVSTAIISGVEEGNATPGTSSRVVLTGVNDRTTFAYTFFGGYVGDGNIQHRIVLPNTIRSIKEAYLELDDGNNFTFYINNNLVGTFYKGTGGGNTKNLTADKWVLDASALTYLTPGTNFFNITFLTQQVRYIGGGFFRVKYSTDELDTSLVISQGNYSKKLNYLPGLDGAVNLFDSFYVPGDLVSLNIYLKLKSPYRNYMTVANTTIFTTEGSSNVQEINLTDVNFTSLSYPSLSRITVPIKIGGIYNFSINETGIADIVLVTDFSGSMKKAVEDWDQGNQGGSTNDCVGTVYNVPDIRRTVLAQCLDKEFVINVMNGTFNRLLPIFMYNDRIENNSNYTSFSAINSYIDSYNVGSGYTCLSCALNTAYNFFANYSNPTREKFIVLMSDGIPDTCAVGDPYCNVFNNGTLPSTTLTCGTGSIGGLCDTNGNCDYNPDVINGCNDCKLRDIAANATYNAAKRLKNKFNATIFTIGFGPTSDCSEATKVLNTTAALTNGSYFQSNSPTILRQIYQNISDEIKIRLNQTSQSLIITGNITNPSIIFSDSYIQYTYNPIFPGIPFGYIPVTLETPRFSNNISNGTFLVPSGAVVSEARVTSYSADRWTNYVEIKDGSLTKVFNLTNYGTNYHILGDPFIVEIPTNFVSAGKNNTVRVGTAVSYQDNITSASPDAKAIYTLNIDTLINFSIVSPQSEGCIWAVNYEDGSSSNLRVPSTYAGSDTCTFTSNLDCDAQFNVDAIDNSVCKLFQKLDFDNDGSLDVNFNTTGIDLQTISISGIPYLWGPTTVEARVWQ